MSIDGTLTIHTDGTTAPEAGPPPRQDPRPRRYPPRFPHSSQNLPLQRLCQMCPRPRPSPMDLERQLSRRQEPSDQPASPSIAPGPPPAQELPSTQEDAGG